MAIANDLGDLLDSLEVGLSAVTWCPQDPSSMEWVFVNEARCRMVGYAKVELLSLPTINITTREVKAQTQAIVENIQARGYHTIESTLLHKSGTVVPVRMHMKLLKRDDVEVLLVEHHDISSYKVTEARLFRAEENTREMLRLIEQEKQQLSKNIEDNLGLVVFPLLNQLRVSATSAQKTVLDLLESRIRHVTKGLGITARFGSLGVDLTRRQMVICEMIREGMSSKEIAKALDCAPSTINNHRNTIRKKLGISGKFANLQAFLSKG
jgi:PAS domain S-box-containing protein